MSKTPAVILKVDSPFDWLSWMQEYHVELAPEFDHRLPLVKNPVPMLWRAGLCAQYSYGWTMVEFYTRGKTPLAALKKMRSKINKRARSKRVKIRP